MAPGFVENGSFRLAKDISNVANSWCMSSNGQETQRFVQTFEVLHLHPGRLTWNLKITCLKRKIIFQTSISMFHVNLRGCSHLVLRICINCTWCNCMSCPFPLLLFAEVVLLTERTTQCTATSTQYSGHESLLNQTGF